MRLKALLYIAAAYLGLRTLWHFDKRLDHIDKRLNAIAAVSQICHCSKE